MVNRVDNYFQNGGHSVTFTFTELNVKISNHTTGLCSTTVTLTICNRRTIRPFFIFRFTDPPEPFFGKLKKNKRYIFRLYFFVSLRLMPVQYWSSIMFFFRFFFSTAAKMIKLPPMTAPCKILPFLLVK